MILAPYIIIPSAADSVEHPRGGVIDTPHVCVAQDPDQAGVHGSVASALCFLSIIQHLINVRQDQAETRIL